MNYTFFAIGCYIVMRAVPVLFEDQAQQKWYKVTLKVIALITLYAGLASVIVWYKEMNLLGFDPGD
jgi:uncharacterized membrane protein